MNREKVMNETQLQELETRIRERKARVEKDLVASEQARLEKIRPPGEVADVSTHSADQDIEGLDQEVTIEKNLRNELEQLNHALERLLSGSFGKCQRCGQDIATQRLEAIPYTSYCLECEQAAEA